MLDIASVCNLYAWLYTDQLIPPGTFDRLVPVDGCYCAIKRVDSVDYVLFRGSVTVLDWMADFWRPGEPYWDPQLGGVHPGFLVGVKAIQAKVDALVGDNVVVVGHSLGAGHAQLYAARRLANGMKVNRLLLFGSPRAGMQALASILEHAAIWSFRNQDPDGHDLVTDVPLKLGPLLAYCHPCNLTDVSKTPPAGDGWGLFRYHHFGLYCAALGATGPAAASLAV